eukprot:CAMPEP_0185735014 /NCGR_PEP_ID=MMETSP1171-20130828/24110_1 /TAXON_ID=374046 /ORGANISM="Helicotheca tamensis, Strain CCMP826" /LENGTH=189 /DNA_ID=CAMNT_0028405177 /DNA_START=205 /DNA_END=774 /DNA_ORIENTATION=-
MSEAIVAAIKERGGRFIHQSPFDGCWANLMESAAIEKTTEALDTLVGEDVEQKENPSQQKMSKLEHPQTRSTMVQQSQSQSPEYHSNPRKRYRSSSSNSSLLIPIPHEGTDFSATNTTRPSLENFCLEYLASNENNTGHESQTATLGPPKKVTSNNESELGHNIGNSAARSSVEVCEELLGTNFNSGFN